MPKTSAGVLAYHLSAGQLAVFLVHPGGPFFKNKDEGAWSIPKGEYENEEDPLMVAAREFEEETGNYIQLNNVTRLDPVKLRSGKIITAFAIAVEPGLSFRGSNTFTIEWPPRSGIQSEFPEVDKGEWFSIEVAMQKVNPAQVHLLLQLKATLGLQF